MCFKPLWNVVTPKIAGECLQKYGHILKWKHPNAHVIDIGCGEGNVTSKVLYPYIKDRIEKLTAIDISHECIEYAKKENSMSKIDYQVVDARSIEFPKKMVGAFEHIFSFYAAQWMPDQQTFTSGLHKMVKPNGQIFVTHIAHSPLHDSFNKHFKEQAWAKYLPQEMVLLDYTDDPAGYIRKIIEEVGFKVEVCELKTHTEPVENSQEFIRSLASIHPYLDRIPHELREDYYQDHVKYALGKSRYMGEPNVYEFPFDTLTCIASK